MARMIINPYQRGLADPARKWEVGSRKWEVARGKWEVGSGNLPHNAPSASAKARTTFAGGVLQLEGEPCELAPTHARRGVWCIG